MMDIIAKAGFVQSFLAFLLGCVFMVTLTKLHFDKKRNNGSGGDKSKVTRAFDPCPLHDTMQTDILDIKKHLHEHGEKISSMDKNIAIIATQVTNQEKAIIELSFNMKNSNETNRLLLEQLQIMNVKRTRRN